MTGQGRDPDSDDRSSFDEIMTFHLHHLVAQIVVKIASTIDDQVPAEFTLMKECHDGTGSTTSQKEVRKIRGEMGVMGMSAME